MGLPPNGKTYLSVPAVILANGLACHYRDTEDGRRQILSFMAPEILLLCGTFLFRTYATVRSAFVVLRAETDELRAIPREATSRNSTRSPILLCPAPKTTLSSRANAAANSVQTWSQCEQRICHVCGSSLFVTSAGSPHFGQRTGVSGRPTLAGVDIE
jgi:hypothetical protein